MKKAISPLISTILIIGFAVLLAVFVLNWGLTFSSKLTDTTEQSVEKATTCLEDIEIEVGHVCYDPINNKVVVQIENRKDSPLSSLLFRIFYDDDVDLIEGADVEGVFPLESFNINSYKIPYDNDKLPSKVDVLPRTILNQEEITCGKKLISKDIYSECS